MKLVYLSGGVGGARLLTGLDQALPSGSLVAVVNTADDFDHWGLRVCPDLDTVMYNLAGLAHPERGWGLAEENHRVAKAMIRYGGADWFQLSDEDLATHLRRTQLLGQGRSLTQVTAALCEGLGLQCPVLPMTDAAVETMIECEDGRVLPFQHWFVKERHAPAVRRVFQAGNFADSDAVISAVEAADAVLIGPSNPYVSIDPILIGAKTRRAVAHTPCFAVSPIVAGKAIKGPLAGMIESLAQRPASAQTIAEHYLNHGERHDGQGLPLQGMLVERGDEFALKGVDVRGTSTVMTSAHDRLQLAQTAIHFIGDRI